MERWLVLIIISAFMLGCQRDKPGGSSTITIQVPRAANTANKTGGVGAMSALPTDRKVCYGINVSGPGINGESGNSCSPPTSIRAGFVEPGSEVSVSVPKGSNRVVHLFAFLGEPGQTSPCPEFASNLSPSQLVHTYKIGTATNIDISADQTVVEITADFPGLSNHIAAQLGLPATCTAGATPPAGRPGFSAGSGGGKATDVGNTVTMYSSFGRAHSGQTAVGGNITLKTK